MVDLEQPVVDCEIRPMLERVRDANHLLRENRDQESQELVCIETRAACAMFEDVLSWSGRSDQIAQTALVDALANSLQLLTSSRADERIINAVKRRLTEIKKFDVSHLVSGASG